MHDARTARANAFARAFGLVPTKISTLLRADAPNASELHVVTDRAGDQFVLKISTEIDVAAERALNALTHLSSRRFGLITGIAAPGGSCVTRDRGDAATLTRFVPHVPLTPARVPLDRLLDAIVDFHDLVRNLPAPARPHKTFESYVQRGAQLLPPRHPLAARWTSFAVDRWPDVRATYGVIHFDLHRFNIWVGVDDEIHFADFDEMQTGPLVKDILDAAASYLGVTRESITIADDDLRMIQRALNLVAPGLTASEHCLLLLRPRAAELGHHGSAIDRFLAR